MASHQLHLHQTNQLARKVRILYEGLKLYQERLWSRNGRGIFHNSANNRERWSQKSDFVTLSKLWDDMLSRIRPKKGNKFSVCILYPVCSLHFVPRLHFVSGMQSAVSILYWPDWYCCFCSSEPQVRTEILGLEKKILVGLSWPLWLMSGLYVEELPRKSTVIEQWLLYTNWRRTQMRGLPIWLPLIPFRVVTACVEMNPLRVP